MSDDREPVESQESETPASETEAASAAEPKDLPVAIVIVTIAVAALIFGGIGWKRYQAMKEELMRERGQMMEEAMREGVAGAHRQRADGPAQDPEPPATQTQQTQPATTPP